MGSYGLLIIAFLFGLYAQFSLKTTYARYSNMFSSRGISGMQAARYILDSNGIQSVKIEPISGNLTDHYDPGQNVVRLSEGVYGSTSIAAIGIAAHECGHAIQHSVGYFPLTIRNLVIPITNFGSKLAIPLILIGLIFNSQGLTQLGIIAYSLITIFQLITLPIEFDASRRALNIIKKTEMLQGEEYEGAKQTLKAAAMTYVAALASSASQLLYMINLVNRRNRRR